LEGGDEIKETGSWKLDAGDWKLGSGIWRLKFRDLCLMKKNERNDKII
jgi:hypothetical protein